MMTRPLPCLSSMRTLRPRRALEILLGFVDVGIGLLFACKWFRLFGFGIEKAMDEGFGLSDGHMQGGNLLGGGSHGLGAVEGEEGAGVTEGKLACFYFVLNQFREAEEAEEVGDAGAAPCRCGPAICS